MRFFEVYGIWISSATTNNDSHDESMMSYKLHSGDMPKGFRTTALGHSGSFSPERCEGQGDQSYCNKKHDAAGKHLRGAERLL